MKEATYIDLSHPIHDAMPVYPGDEPVSFQQINHVEKDGFSNFKLSAGMHFGTHIDTPAHMLKTGGNLQTIPPDRFFGNGVLIDCRQTKEIQWREAYRHQIKKGDMILFHTGHDQHFGQERYYTNYPVLSEEFAIFLIKTEVNMVLFDTPSPDEYPFPLHKKFFEANIPIVENLTNLDQLTEAEAIEIFALPLHVPADGAPIRVVAKYMI